MGERLGLQHNFRLGLCSFGLQGLSWMQVEGVTGIIPEVRLQVLTPYNLIRENCH